MALPKPSGAKELKHIRIIQKHETEANWNKATKFTPELGEVIIYDPDETHTRSRIKVGDGVRIVSELPFSSQNVDFSVVEVTDDLIIDAEDISALDLLPSIVDGVSN